MKIEFTKKNTNFMIYIIAIFLAISAGMSNVIIIHDIGKLISESFLRIFKCLSMPIIFLSLIVSLTHKNENSENSILWRKTFLYTFTTTLVAAAITSFLYVIIKPVNVIDSISNKIGSSDISLKDSQNYFNHILTLIPNNFISPFLDNQIITTLLLGLIIGTGVNTIKTEDTKNTLTNFFRGLHELLLNITGWIVKVMPLALFSFIMATVLQLKQDPSDIIGIGQYLSVIVLANFVQGLVILPLWLKLRGISPVKIAKAMIPSISMAFFSKSSTSTLPLSMSLSQEKLGFSKKISHLVFPLCTSINMNGCAAFIFATVIYLMQNHGIEISFFTILTWIFISTIAAIGNAGIPMGCFFLSASLLSNMNIPIELLGLILPFYGIIDMIETSLNVWSDISVASAINQDHENLKIT